MKVYHTPYPLIPQVPGAVSETEFTVVPAKLVVPQGREVALEQASLAGGVGQLLEIVKVPLVLPLV